MQISCSIVCYHNAPEQIAQVLASVAASGIQVDLYVVDNSATDTLSKIARQFGATYIHLPQNPGFGAGHNVALLEAFKKNAEFHLVLNPDIRFGEDVIPQLVAYLQQHSEIGLVMPGIFYPDGKQQHLCKLLPNPVDLMIRRLFPTLFRLSGRLASYEMHASGYDKVMDVPALSGCFMLMRTSILRKTGGFDDRFFMYMEDVDLSRRIGRVSRTVYFPFVSVIHDYGKGSYKSLKLLYYHARSAILYFNKWGWFSDAEKQRANRAALQKIQSINSQSINSINNG
jgi:GT2 family glycosyltransferase